MYLLVNIIHLALICLFVMFFLYIRDLEQEKCACSDDWKRDYIKYFTAFMILTNTVSIFYPNFKQKIFGRLNLVLGLLGIAYVFIIITWINSLDKEKCKCSKGCVRCAMKFYAYFLLVLLLVMLVMSIIIHNRISHLSHKMKPLTKKQRLQIRKIMKKMGKRN